MATNLEQSDARLRYLEKKRADTANRVRRCRAHEAENEEQQAQSTTLRDGRLVVSRSLIPLVSKHNALVQRLL